MLTLAPGIAAVANFHWGNASLNLDPGRVQAGFMFKRALRIRNFESASKLTTI